MNNRMSRLVLMAHFLDRTPVRLWTTTGQQQTGIITTIQLEDGSGHSFNVLFGNGMGAYVRGD